jgi:hypothetical protein
MYMIFAEEGERLVFHSQAERFKVSRTIITQCKPEIGTLHDRPKNILYILFSNR